MNGLISKFKKNNNKNTFLKRAEHRWFNSSNNILECFSTLHTLSTKSKTLKKLLNETLFISNSGQYACSIHANINIIVIYPELTALMRNGESETAIAILLHELGHLALNHQTRGIENDQAQIEADLFACEFGYSNEIYRFLQGQTKSQQVAKRLHAIERTFSIMN